MLRSGELKGVVRGLAETFISRNNDVGGYWGIGMLYLEAQEQGLKTLEFNLVSRLAVPGGEVANRVVFDYSGYLARRLVGLPVQSAGITLTFGTFGNYPAPPYVLRGDPFFCAVRLVSISGKMYTCVRTGWAAPHSSKDIRSTRGGL